MSHETLPSSLTTLPASLRASLQTTRVSYKQLGSSGLRVSVPILGAMSFGSREWSPWVVDKEEQVFDLLRGAYDCGINTWDTANVYSNGQSEMMIGRTIRRFNIPRSKLVLLSKCFGTVGEEPDVTQVKYGKEMQESKDYVNQGGLSRTAIFNAVEASLKRLQTHYLDVLQIHRFDSTVPVEETMKALHDLIESGKVRYIGASSMWTYQFQRMQNVAEQRGWTKFVSMQNHYSLCYREEEREMNRYCRETGVGLIPWAPLYRGHLARPSGRSATEREQSAKGGSPLTEADREIIRRVAKVADHNGWKMSQVALIWIVQKGTVPIVGFNSVTRLDEAVDIRGKVLTDSEMQYLEEAYVPKPISGHT